MTVYTCEGALYVDNVLFFWLSKFVLNEILALKYCNPVFKKKPPSLHWFLLTINTLLGELRQSYFQKMVSLRIFFSLKRRPVKKGGVAYF